MARTRPSPDSGRTISWPGLLADAALIVAFLGLVFLLGVFPQKDFDIWFHLRTGDLIRQGKPIPSHDLYTYTAPDSRWIDLHWGFQVAASWAYARGGFRGLNLAKCGVTALAMLVLITARRRDWPVWAMVMAWLPALFLLGGRMYVRPETLTLLYLSIFLAVIHRWERSPRWAFALPVVAGVLGQLAGPVRAGADRPGDGPARRRHRARGVVLGAEALVADGRAGFVADGARLPGEPVPAGRCPLPGRAGADDERPRLQRAHRRADVDPPLHPDARPVVAAAPAPFRRPGSRPAELPPAPGLAAPVLGGPTARVQGDRGTRRGDRGKTPQGEAEAQGEGGALLAAPAVPGVPLRGVRAAEPEGDAEQPPVRGGRRGGHGLELRRVGRRPRARSGEAPRSRGIGRGAPAACALAFGALGAAALFVATGTYYDLAGEGRTVGLGEQPLWYPHAAAEFAGGPGMPRRMLGFHLGYPAMYEYYHGPSHKVFADPRLEVVGPDLYKRYLDAQRRITEEQPGWAEWLDDQGRPVIVADNASQGGDRHDLDGGPRVALAMRVVRPGRLGLPPRAGREGCGRRPGRLPGQALPPEGGRRPRRRAGADGLGLGDLDPGVELPAPRPARPGAGARPAGARPRPPHPRGRPRLGDRLAADRPARACEGARPPRIGPFRGSGCRSTRCSTSRPCGGPSR